MIELAGVTKMFGAKRAVDRLDMTVRAGELYAFLGPNGAGKTTTIKMICGLLAPTAGTVRVGGHDAASREARQLLGYVPDQPYLYDKLTGREFLKFVVEMYAMNRTRAMNRIEELIETFEMAAFIDELCENYSQGMKQRVVFASALVHNPKVLVVDEPLVGLDPRSARIVKNLFVSQARAGAAVLMSIHLLAIAEELADTIGIVDHGRMLTVGTLAQLRERAQHDGPLEDLFLKLTGYDLPIPAIPGAVPVELPGTCAMSLAIPEPIRLPELAHDRTAAALRWLRWRQLRNTISSVLRGSRLRISMILFCSAVFWGGLFVLFLGGFQFIGIYVDLFNTLVEYFFSMFFLSLLIMLFFSTGIIVYTTLFHSREAAFLLTTPASADRIFAYKFAEAIGFSSWGFFLLGSPLMVAYGLTVKAPAAFYAMFLAYLVSFVLVPGSVGAVAAILVANLFPRRQKTVLTLSVAGVLGVAAIFGFRLWRMPGETFSGDWLGSALNRLAFCQHPLWPSRWMSAGLLASAKGEWSQAGYHLMVLSAHAGLAYLAAAVAARDLYRRGYSRVQGGRTSRRRTRLAILDPVFHRAFFFLPHPIRLLILKDLRTFLRDPAQWSQFLIFFGLLAFYFLNIPRLGYGVQTPYWRNLVSFLNLSVTALILSTFTSRFIFPLLSLEGRNFWVLGLLPLRREQILWGKFAFSAGISLVATEVLVVLSDLMLKLSGVMILLHVGMIAVLCLGLSGISVGLGARLPNLRETNPSKIAAGFGGTLNLLVSLVFIFAIITVLSLPCHLYFAGQEHPESSRLVLSHAGFRFWLSAAIIVSLIVGAVGTIVPLRIGIKSFQRMEF